MKKAIMIAVFVIVLAVIFTIPATLYAHPNVPAQSLGKISPNAAGGIHTAVGNLDGVAYHVFQERFNPHN